MLSHKRKNFSAYLKTILFALLTQSGYSAFGQNKPDCENTFFHVSQSVYSAAKRTSASDAKTEYEVQRPLASYLTKLRIHNIMSKKEYKFEDDLIKLSKDETWVDLGCGEGKAISELYSHNINEFLKTTNESEYLEKRKEFRDELLYLLEAHNIRPNSTSQAMANYFKPWNDKISKLFGREKSEKPKAIGVTYEMHNKIENTEKMEFKVGRFFHDIPNEEFGKVKLITDFFGVFSYMQNINQYFSKIHKMLDLEGTAYIFNADTVIYSKYSAPNSTLNLGDDINFWLKHHLKDKTAKGFEIDSEYGKYVVKKNDDQFLMPSLTLIGYKEGRPPTRIYVDETLPVNSVNLDFVKRAHKLKDNEIKL